MLTFIATALSSHDPAFSLSIVSNTRNNFVRENLVLSTENVYSLGILVKPAGY